MLLDASQAVVARYLYDPYGNLLAKTGPQADANLYRFSSKELHLASGLVYYLYRYYEPTLQRWVNRDPLGQRSAVNLFSSFANRPSGAFDSWGLRSTEFSENMAYYNMMANAGAAPPPGTYVEPVWDANRLLLPTFQNLQKAIPSTPAFTGHLVWNPNIPPSTEKSPEGVTLLDLKVTSIVELQGSLGVPGMSFMKIYSSATITTWWNTWDAEDHEPFHITAAIGLMRSWLAVVDELERTPIPTRFFHCYKQWAELQAARANHAYLWLTVPAIHRVHGSLSQQKVARKEGGAGKRMIDAFDRNSIDALFKCLSDVDPLWYFLVPSPYFPPMQYIPPDNRTRVH